MLKICAVRENKFLQRKLTFFSSSA